MHQEYSQPFLPPYSVATDQIILLSLLPVYDKQTSAGAPVSDFLSSLLLSCALPFDFSPFHAAVPETTAISSSMDSTRSCANCKKTGIELKACSRSKTAQYCGRDCQKADRKSHKKTCSAAAQSAFVQGATEHSSTYSAPRLKNIEKHEPKPFTKLDQGAYLRDRPEADTFKLLIDSFRLREADDLQFDNKTKPQSVYTGAADSTAPFREYVGKAWNKNLLPPWWNDAKTLECVTFGLGDAWSDLRKRLTKADIIKRYGDQKMPMQLRMLAEMVYGRGLMGQDGTGARKQMVMMENGGPGNDMVASMLSLNAR